MTVDFKKQTKNCSRNSIFLVNEIYVYFYTHFKLVIVKDKFNHFVVLDEPPLILNTHVVTVRFM